MGRQEIADKRQRDFRYFDYSLLIMVFFLVCFGLVMLYSTSSYNGQVKFKDSAYYLKKQLFADVLGIAVMAFVAQIDYRVWKKFWLLAYIGAFGMCTLVLFVGQELNGAKRWLKLGPISFQPSEMAKVAIIVFLATIISQMPKQMGKFSALIKVMLMVMPMVVIVASENLSTAIIILGIAICLVFVSSPKYMQFIVMGGVVIGFGAAFIMLESYRAERLKI